MIIATNGVEQEVAQDGILVTSRKPDDIPAFSKAFIGQMNKAMAEVA